MKLPLHSLATRITLLMVTALILVQALSLALHRLEREAVVGEMAGLRAADRIVDLVNFLNATTAAIPLSLPGLEVAPVTGSGLGGGDMSSGFAQRLIQKLGANLIEGISDAPQLQAQLQLADGRRIIVTCHQTHAETDIPAPPPWGFLLLAMALVFGTSVSALWIIRPLRQLKVAAEKMDTLTQGEPLAQLGPDEVVAVLSAFNSMRQRIHRQIAARIEMLAAISHDLKSPLTRLKLRAELVPDENMRGQLICDLDEMEAMVSSTLDYMQTLDNCEPEALVNLQSLLEALRDDVLDTGAKVTMNGTVNAPIQAQPVALRRCISNLLDNAIHYANGAELAVEDDGNAVTLRVLDRGPSIPDGELEQVFEPYYRGDKSRGCTPSGNGLGLSIARNIALAHGGMLTLSNRHDGGLEACLILPRKNIP